MSYTYTQQKKKNSQKKGTEPFSGGKMESSLPNSAMVENPGHQVDMPTVMREKMEGAFDMNLSGVKLYENKAVGEAGAEAVAQGSNIAFAPGKLDFSSTHGQALLGHEISHVASQAKGEVKGSGLVNDSALEARADREGAMAARGESVTMGYGGASEALSNASAASASGPMQAKSGKKKKEKELRDRERAEMMESPYSLKAANEEDELDNFDRNKIVDEKELFDEDDPLVYFDRGFKSPEEYEAYKMKEREELMAQEKPPTQEPIQEQPQKKSFGQRIKDFFKYLTGDPEGELLKDGETKVIQRPDTLRGDIKDLTYSMGSKIKNLFKKKPEKKLYGKEARDADWADYKKLQKEEYQKHKDDEEDDDNISVYD